MIIIEMVEGDAMQLPRSLLRRLVSVDPRGALQKKTCIHEHSGQHQAGVAQKKSPGVRQALDK